MVVCLFLKKERKTGKEETAVEQQFCRWEMGEMKCIAIVQNKVVAVLCVVTVQNQRSKESN